MIDYVYHLNNREKSEKIKEISIFDENNVPSKFINKIIGLVYNPIYSFSYFNRDNKLEVMTIKAHTIKIDEDLEDDNYYIIYEIYDNSYFLGNIIEYQHLNIFFPDFFKMLNRERVINEVLENS